MAYSNSLYALTVAVVVTLLILLLFLVLFIYSNHHLSKAVQQMKHEARNVKLSEGMKLNTVPESEEEIDEESLTVKGFKRKTFPLPKKGASVKLLGTQQGHIL